jgi:8-oxo-dGTP pyrophosphatase MutT (NUDIX family)
MWPVRWALIEAAGGLVWREGKKHVQIAVIHRPRQNDWSLPKGKRKAGESWRETAEREVAEEIGCKVRVGPFAGWNLYFYRRRPKLVMFWHMEVRHAARFEANHEVDGLAWLDPREALERLDHPAQRRLLRKVLRQKKFPPQ